jgi:iron complex transport system substrate-binding protein
MDRGPLLRRALLVLPIVLALGVLLADTLASRFALPSGGGHGVPGLSRTVVDQWGTPVALPEKVERIGTPGISMASLILALGGRKALAAVTPEVAGNPWLQRVLPEVAQLPTPFSRPSGVNLEALMALKPDLVTLWGSGQPLATPLAQANIPVLRLAYANPVEMVSAVRVLGAALGAEGVRRAALFIRYYENNLQRVATALGHLSERERPRVYYASIAPLHTEGSQSMVDAWITAAGGINLAARAGLKGDGQVNLEDVLAWNPQVIITLDAAQRDAILADPRWHDVAAVRQGRVLASPGGVNAWCTRAAETALQVLWAAQVFHPERFRTLNLTAETRAFYRQFYGYTLDDGELARVLQGKTPPALSSRRNDGPGKESA